MVLDIGGSLLPIGTIRVADPKHFKSDPDITFCFESGLKPDPSPNCTKLSLVSVTVNCWYKNLKLKLKLYHLSILLLKILYLGRYEVPVPIRGSPISPIENPPIMRQLQLELLSLIYFRLFFIYSADSPEFHVYVPKYRF